MGCIGFSAAVGLAMTVGRCVANWKSVIVQLSLRGLRWLNLWHGTSPKQSSWPMSINFEIDVGWI
ncbi:MAG: hypothetical protein FWC76_05430, partial [Defluviitaleaceae bacterium]|nr:hypothetical protein [Defluviitaleaceae bacterium]